MTLNVLQIKEGSELGIQLKQQYSLESETTEYFKLLIKKASPFTGLSPELIFKGLESMTWYQRTFWYGLMSIENQSVYVSIDLYFGIETV